jgi:hypothetical protein
MATPREWRLDVLGSFYESLDEIPDSDVVAEVAEELIRRVMETPHRVAMVPGTLMRVVRGGAGDDLCPALRLFYTVDDAQSRVTLLWLERDDR